MTHTLKFPFRLPAGRDISGLDQPFTTSVGAFTWSIQRRLRGFLVTVNGLESEKECYAYLKRMWSGFNWLLLKREIAPIA